MYLGGPDVIERINLLLHVCINVYHVYAKIGALNMLQAVQYGQAMKHKQVRLPYLDANGNVKTILGTRSTTVYYAIPKASAGYAIHGRKPGLHRTIQVSTSCRFYQ